MLTAVERALLIDKIRVLPDELERLVAPLSDEQLDARPTSEWSVRQNVHHLADSHMNAFIRVKLALLEDHPTLKPYNQDDWADSIDGKNPPISYSMAILRGLHARWVALFASLSDEQFQRTAYHPENGDMRVEDFLSHYAAHGEGHLIQIREALAAANIAVTWA
ncbi:MAG: putative metal-dependent hydrolase [Anaerolineae bacterium]